MNRVIHFEVHATDPERAAQFYRTVSGWEIKEWMVPGVQIQNENAVALPKMPIEGVGWLTYYKDTEGSIFGMMQDDENAG